MSAQHVAGEVGALGERQRLAEEGDRGAGTRDLEAAGTEAEEELGAVKIRELRTFGNRESLGDELDPAPRITVLHGGPRFARARADLELRRVRRGDGTPDVAVGGKRVLVVMSLGQGLGLGEQRFDAAPLVRGHATGEEGRIHVQALREPFDGLLRGPGLAALDLADVLLREALTRELRLGQAGRDAQEAQPVAEPSGHGGRGGETGVGGRGVVHSVVDSVKWRVERGAYPFAGIFERTPETVLASEARVPPNHLTVLLDFFGHDS